MHLGRKSLHRIGIGAALAILVGCLGAWGWHSASTRQEAVLRSCLRNSIHVSVDSLARTLASVDKRWLSTEGKALYNHVEAKKLVRQGRYLEADSLAWRALRYFDYNTEDSVEICRLSLLEGIILYKQRDLLKASLLFTYARNHLPAMPDDAVASCLIEYYLGLIGKKYQYKEHIVKHFQAAVKDAFRANDEHLVWQTNYQLALAYLENKQYDKALKTLYVALEYVPEADMENHGKMLRWIAAAYEKQQNPARALEILRKTRSTWPEDAKDMLLKGKSYGSLHQKDSALYYLRKVIETCPDDYKMKGEAYKQLHIYHLENHETQQALNSLMQYVACKDSNKYVRERERWERLSLLWGYRESQQEVEKARYQLWVKERQVVRIVVGTLLVCALLCAINLYSRKKSLKNQLACELEKQKNQRLEYEKTEILRLKLQEELHVKQLEKQHWELQTNYYKQLNAIVLPLLGQSTHKLSTDDWQRIYHNTDACFPGFTDHIRQRFPQLGEDDVRLCCLLKMGLSVEQIAGIWFIEANSVVKRKSRLQSKMGIKNPLDSFLKTFGG